MYLYVDSFARIYLYLKYCNLKQHFHLCICFYNYLSLFIMYFMYFYVCQLEDISSLATLKFKRK